MRDGQYGAVGKLVSNGALNERVGFEIHCCGSLVQNQNFGLTKQCTCQANQLPLANRKILAILHNGIIESRFKTRNVDFQM